MLLDKRARVVERRQIHHAGDDDRPRQRTRQVRARHVSAAAPCRDQSSPARSEILTAAHRYRRSDCKPRMASRRRRKHRPACSCRSMADRDGFRRPSRRCRKWCRSLPALMVRFPSRNSNSSAFYNRFGTAHFTRFFTEKCFTISRAKYLTLNDQATTHPFRQLLARSVRPNRTS